MRKVWRGLGGLGFREQVVMLRSSEVQQVTLGCDLGSERGKQGGEQKDATAGQGR